MAKRRTGIVRKKKIVINGKEIEVDTFDAEVVLGSGEELESVDELLKQEEAEKAIQDALSKIEIIAYKYVDKQRDIWYYYEVGKVLQFVDNRSLADRRRGLIWRRIAYDLRPDLFGGKKKNAQESRRYPETMYHLGKQLKSNVERANFNQWYEILKFKNIYKDNNLLEQVLSVCGQGTSGIQLRQKIKDLRAAKNKAK